MGMPIHPTNNAPDQTETQEEVDEDIDTQDETIVQIGNEPLDEELALIRKSMETNQQSLHKVKNDVIDLQDEFNQLLSLIHI